MNKDIYIRTRIIRQLIFTVGFIPGLWYYFGVDPEAEVAYAFFDVFAAVIKETASSCNVNVSFWGSMSYSIANFIEGIVAMVFAYIVGGGWAILLIFVSFIGGATIAISVNIMGFQIGAVGIWLISLAWFVALFIPPNEEWAI